MNTANISSTSSSSRVFFQLGLLAAAFVLGGCGASSVQVQVPATELAKLSPPRMKQSEEWPTVRTVEGAEKQIIGTIESVQVNTPEGWVPIGPMFYTRVNGPFFEIMDPVGIRGFPLASIPSASVTYADESLGRKYTGVALVATGTPLAVLGGIGIAAGSDIVSRSSGIGGLFTGAFGGFVAILGFVGVAGGLGMAIPGVVMLATNPSKPRGDQAKLQPELHLGPGGASLTVSF
jgi:hypothetical protein